MVRFRGGGRRISRELDVVREPGSLERDEGDADDAISEGGCGLVVELAGPLAVACGGFRTLRIGCSTASARGQSPSGGGEAGDGGEGCGGRVTEDCRCWG